MVYFRFTTFPRETDRTVTRVPADYWGTDGAIVTGTGLAIVYHDVTLFSCKTRIAQANVRSFPAKTFPIHTWTANTVVYLFSA